MNKVKRTSLQKDLAEDGMYHFLTLPPRQRNKIERERSVALVVGDRLIRLQVKRKRVINCVLYIGFDEGQS